MLSYSEATCTKRENRAEPTKHETRRMAQLAHPIQPENDSAIYNYLVTASTAVLHTNMIYQVDFHALQGTIILLHRTLVTRPRYAYTLHVHMITSGRNCESTPR